MHAILREPAKRNYLILAAVVVVGAVLRLRGIGLLWDGFDEKFTLGIASMPWSGFLRAMLTREMNMVAYYFLVRLWVDLYAGLDPFLFVRLLSVLFSVATIPALYALGRKLFNENVGLLAAGLLAINAFHIKHAQNARAYSMFAFLVVVATLLLVDNLKSSAPKWVPYLLIWIVTCYTHVFAFWFLAAHLIVIAYTGIRPRLWQLAGLAAGVAPMALWAVGHHGQPITWVEPTTVRGVAELFATLVGNDGFFLLALAAAAMLPIIVGLARGVERNSASVKLLLVWSLAPVALAIAVSFVQPCLVPRFLLPCLPATTLLLAVGIERGARIKLGRFDGLPAAVLLALIVFGMLMGSQPIGA